MSSIATVYAASRGDEWSNEVSSAPPLLRLLRAVNCTERHSARSSRYAGRPAPAIIANKGTCLVKKISAGLSRGGLCFQGAGIASLHIA